MDTHPPESGPKCSAQDSFDMALFIFSWVSYDIYTALFKPQMDTPPPELGLKCSAQDCFVILLPPRMWIMRKAGADQGEEDEETGNEEGEEMEKEEEKEKMYVDL